MTPERIKEIKKIADWLLNGGPDICERKLPEPWVEAKYLDYDDDESAIEYSVLVSDAQVFCVVPPTDDPAMTEEMAKAIASAGWAIIDLLAELTERPQFREWKDAEVDPVCPQCGQHGLVWPRTERMFCEDCGWPDEDFRQED